MTRIKPFYAAGQKSKNVLGITFGNLMNTKSFHGRAHSMRNAGLYAGIQNKKGNCGQSASPPGTPSSLLSAHVSESCCVSFPSSTVSSTLFLRAENEVVDCVAACKRAKPTRFPYFSLLTLFTDPWYYLQSPLRDFSNTVVNWSKPSNPLTIRLHSTLLPNAFLSFSVASLTVFITLSSDATLLFIPYCLYFFCAILTASLCLCATPNFIANTFLPRSGTLLDSC